VWLGIDFSGDITKWRPRCARPSVWIAEIIAAEAGLELRSLCPVQALTGDGTPFERLTARLSAPDVQVVAIDAPLGIAAHAMPPGGFTAMVELLTQPEPDSNRPFPRGSTVVCRLLGDDAGYGEKRYRPVTQAWRDRGLNLRSPLWAGPRGGAPLLAAGLQLVSAAGLTVWPMGASPGADLALVPVGAVVEGYPAGQLAVWGLPHTRYNPSTPVARAIRKTLVNAIETHVILAPVFAAAMVECADALDAVLCAVGAHAASRGWVAFPETRDHSGFIYVASASAPAASGASRR
jgi:predicted nuclease with RNAse H fold